MTRYMTNCLKATRNDIPEHADVMVNTEISPLFADDIVKKVDNTVNVDYFSKYDYPVVNPISWTDIPTFNNTRTDFSKDLTPYLQVDDSKTVWADDMESNPSHSEDLSLLPSNRSEAEDSLYSFVQDENDSNEYTD